LNSGALCIGKHFESLQLFRRRVLSSPSTLQLCVPAPLP
jgi:hypothetical protein